MIGTMRIYIDTEFTDFLDCDLISIALVAEDGREFYGERSDYDDASCSAFVREAVLPQLGQFPDRVFTRDALRAEVLAWLDQFTGEPEYVLCFDYGGDWYLLLDLIEEVPDGWLAQQIYSLLDQTQMETYYGEHGGRHHALHDARASRYAANGYEEEGTAWSKLGTACHRLRHLGPTRARKKPKRSHTGWHASPCPAPCLCTNVTAALPMCACSTFRQRFRTNSVQRCAAPAVPRSRARASALGRATGRPGWRAVSRAGSRNRIFVAMLYIYTVSTNRPCPTFPTLRRVRPHQTTSLRRPLRKCVYCGVRILIRTCAGYRVKSRICAACS